VGRYVAGVTRVRTALFLDFDNVFGGLHRIDPEAANEFAERPGVWLRALEDSFTVSGPRRWLVLRCYMNPAGWLPAANNEAGRLYFSRFRPAFTRAGFEVIDCPRLSTTKNAADIRLVLDAVDASSVVPAYEEFVIASGDSDMTPLLVRLRAADRRTTILSPSDAAEAFTAVADRLIGADQVLGLVQGEPDDDDDLDPDTASAAESQASLGTGDEIASALHVARAYVTDHYQRAEAPLNLARLASEIQSEVADSSPPGILRATRWFGAGTFGQFLKGLDLSGMELSQHFLWDAARHTPPHEEVVDETALPSAVERLTVTLSLPRPPRAAWTAMYAALAEYAATHEFKLADATRWGRDQLAEQELPVSRHMAGVVTRASAFGGAPLHAKPAPSAEQISEAVVRNMLGRAGAAGMILTDDEVAEVRSWFGGAT
jgi:hypothetical protein